MWVVHELYQVKYQYLLESDLVYLVNFFVYYGMKSGVKKLINRYHVKPETTALDMAVCEELYPICKLLLKHNPSVTVDQLNVLIKVYDPKFMHKNIL